MLKMVDLPVGDRVQFPQWHMCGTEASRQKLLQRCIESHTLLLNVLANEQLYDVKRCHHHHEMEYDA